MVSPTEEACLLRRICYALKVLPIRKENEGGGSWLRSSLMLTSMELP